MSLRTRVAVIGSVAAVGLGGVTVAAVAAGFAGSGSSHSTAPADKGGVPHGGSQGSANAAKPSGAPGKPSGSAHGVGPDGTGPAAYGLCQAWTHSAQRTKSVHKSVAMRNLATAAGGYDKIDAYCATVPKPSGTDDSDSTDGAPANKPNNANKGKNGAENKPAGTHPSESETPEPAETEPSSPTG